MKNDLGVDSFEEKDATENPKKIIRNYIRRGKCGADFEDAKEYIALIAKVGNHEEKELYDYFIQQMQGWGRHFKTAKAAK